MRVLCNRCKNIFNAEEHDRCPYCGQTGKIPSEADYSRSKLTESEIRRRRSLPEPKIESLGGASSVSQKASERRRSASVRPSARNTQRKTEEKPKKQKPKVEIEYIDDYEASEQGGCLLGTVKMLVFAAAAIVVFFVGLASGYAFLSSYTSGIKNVAENIRPIDSFYSGVQEGFEGYPVIASAFPPYVTENGTDTMKMTYYDNFNTVYAALRSVSGSNYSIDYDITSETKLSNEKIDSIKEAISQKTTAKSDISGGYNIVTKAVVSAGDDLSKVKVEFTTICLNGTWYIYDLNLMEA